MGYDTTQIARKFMDEVLSKGNFNVLDEIVGKDVIVHDLLAPEGRGHEFMKSQVKEYRTAFPDLTFTIDDILQTTGDRVVVQSRGRGTHRGPFLGFPPTNKTATSACVDILRIVNGKIVEHTSFWNAYGVFQQLGFVPALDQLARSMGKGAGTRPEAR